VTAVRRRDWTALAKVEVTPSEGLGTKVTSTEDYGLSLVTECRRIVSLWADDSCVLRPRRPDHYGPAGRVFTMTGSAQYLSWGWLSISLPNLLVISVMIVVFVVAIALPFPTDRDKR
jgi:hypothetical protein